jgi:hypothetical protein
MAGSVTGLNTFGSQAGPIPTSELDTNFSDIAGQVNELNTYSNYYADAGAVNAMAVTIPSTQTYALTAGLQLQIQVLFTNTGPVTLNVNSTGAVEVIGVNGLALIAGELTSGSIVSLIYNGSAWQVIGVASTVSQLIAGSNVVLSPISGTGAVTINATAASGNLYYPIVSEETTAGVTPTAYQWPVGDLRRYGADATGTNDCTSAINQAIKVCSIGVTYTTIYFDGKFNFNPSSLVWASAPESKVTWLVNGILQPTTTIVLTYYYQIIGTGGAGGGSVQFQKGSCCEIVAPSGSIPVIKMVSSADQVLENINIQGAYQGLFFDGANQLGALAKITNVNINLTQAGGSCVYIDAFFWVWFENCTFNAGSYTGSHSIYATNSSTAYSQAGLLYWNNCISSGNGITFNPSVGVVENAWFTNHLHESLPNGATFFTATSNVKDVYMDAALSDSGTGVYTFDVNGMNNLTTNGGEAVTFKSYPAQSSMGNVVDAFDYTNTASNIGATVAAGFGQRRGAIWGRLINRGMLGNPVLGLGSPYTVTITTGSSGNITIGGTYIGPDGSNTAYSVTNISTNVSDYEYASIFSSSITFNTNDIVIFGAMVKANNLSLGAAGQSPLVCSVYPPGSLVFTGPNNQYTANYIYNCIANDSQIYDGGWIPVYGWFQVASGSGTETLTLSVGSTGTNTYNIWNPWLRYISASSGITYQDVNKYLSAVGSIPNIPSGVIGIQRNQTFMTGQNTTSNRPSASAVGKGAQFFDTTLNIPIWSNGTAWVNAAGTTV